MNVDSLREAGLTDGEIKVYLALLKLGSSTVGPIVEESGVARSIMHKILDRLITKGLVSYVTKEKTKHYQAAEPTKLIEYIDEREINLQKNKKEVEAILPQLASLMSGTKQTEVKVYEGFKGITTVHERTYSKLKRGESYFNFGISKDTPEYQQAYWHKDHIRRIKAGIKCQLLFNPDFPEKEVAQRNSYEGCDARFLPLRMNTPAWFMGYKDVAIIGLQQNPIAIEITNQQVADSFRSYFEEFWKQSKKFR